MRQDVSDHLQSTLHAAKSSRNAPKGAAPLLRFYRFCSSTYGLQATCWTCLTWPGGLGLGTRRKKPIPTTTATIHPPWYDLQTPLTHPWVCTDGLKSNSQYDWVKEVIRCGCIKAKRRADGGGINSRLIPSSREQQMPRQTDTN